MHPLRLSLFALLLLAVLGLSQEAEAEKEPIWTYTDESSDLNSVAISGNGEYIAVSVGDESGRNDTGIIYLFRDNQLLWNYTEGDGSNSRREVLISDDGTYVIAPHGRSWCETDCRSPPSFSVFESGNNTPLWQYDNPSTPHVISSDNKYVLVSEGTNLKLLKISNGTEYWNSTDYFIREHVATLSADGEFIVSAGFFANMTSDGLTNSCSGKLMFFSKENSTPLWEHLFFEEDDGSKCDDYSDIHVSLSKNGNFIAMASGGSGVDDVPEQAKIYLYSRENKNPLWEYTPIDGGTFFHSIDMSTDGQYIVASASDDRIYVFHKDSNIPIWTHLVDSVVGDGRAREEILISDDGKYIVCSMNENVAFFQNDSNNLLWEYHFGHDVKQIEMSKDGRFVIVSTSSTAYLFENNIVHQGSVNDAGEDEEGIPGFGIITAVVSIGLIARFMRI